MTRACPSCHQPMGYSSLADFPPLARARYRGWCRACATIGWLAFQAGRGRAVDGWLDAEEFESNMIAAEFYAGQEAR